MGEADISLHCTYAFLEDDALFLVYLCEEYYMFFLTNLHRFILEFFKDD